MDTKKIGLLFPAFGMRYNNFIETDLDGYREEVDKLLSLASKVVTINCRNFDQIANINNDDVEGDLQHHYFCYITSCAISNLLKKHKIESEYVAAYSMGLFAAFYHTSSISFENGLLLMHKACKFAHESINNDQYGMGAIVGISYQDIEKLINKNCNDVEIADVCNEHVIIGAGKRSELEKLLKISKINGCLHSKMLPISLPYHSRFMQNVEGEIIKYISQFDINPPTYKVVSCVDQKILSTAEDVRRELAGNMGQPINWAKTMDTMLALGVNMFIECGLSESLCKLAKFFKGDFKVFHPKKFTKLFGMASNLSVPVAIPRLSEKPVLVVISAGWPLLVMSVSELFSFSGVL